MWSTLTLHSLCLLLGRVEGREGVWTFELDTHSDDFGDHLTPMHSVQEGTEQDKDRDNASSVEGASMTLGGRRTPGRVGVRFDR